MHDNLIACVEAANCHTLRQAELARGLRSRTTAATLLNASSSRSHAGVTLHVCQRRLPSEGREEVLEAKLHLVDLAGLQLPTFLTSRHHRTTCLHSIELCYALPGYSEFLDKNMEVDVMDTRKLP